MAPSPTGFLHIGNVRTALFNWLYARHEGGQFRLRIENTDTSREVAEATDQIQESLRWLGIDWDEEVTFQLDRMERCREEAQRLVAEGKAYEDEGAIRMRMPDEGVTAWDDLIRGRIEYPNEKLEDLVLVRADGRPTYNFASPVEDWLDGVYLRALEPDELAAALITWLREQGYDWDEQLVRASVPLVQEKISKLSEYPEFVRF